MLKLKPDPDNFFICPICQGEQPLIHEFRFESIHTMAACTCTYCSFEFYQVLPSGHTVDYQISIGKKDGVIYHPDKCPEWLLSFFTNVNKETHSYEVPIERIIYKNCSSVVILNTLDFLYGHVLLKLYNSLYHLNQQNSIGLIIIIPKIFKWLIPKGCAEVWVVDIKLSELIYRHDSIQKFIDRESDRFCEIYLSRAYSHPVISAADIKLLTGVRPFDLDKFSVQKPVITFILREDRWWFKDTSRFWIYRVCRKLKMLSWGSHMLSLMQNRLVKQTMRLIKKAVPDVEFFVIGLGKTGKYFGYAEDLRYNEIKESIEKNWCEVYAKSHVVIGVHGSNMLLPTALAAGCVEILPEERFGNIIQDISVKYEDRKQLFFYRFVDQFANPKSVASKAIAILQDYETFNKNMCLHTYPV